MRGALAFRWHEVGHVEHSSGIGCCRELVDDRGCPAFRLFRVNRQLLLTKGQEELGLEQARHEERPHAADGQTNVDVTRLGEAVVAALAGEPFGPHELGLVLLTDGR